MRWLFLFEALMTDRAARIIVRHQRDGRAELSAYVPGCQEVRTRWMVGPGRSAIEGQIVKMKETIERGGVKVVSVKELQV